MLNRIKEYRKRLGLTQTELADQLGTNKSYISQIETGYRDITRIHNSTKARLCHAFSCRFEDLIIEIDVEKDSSENLVVDRLFRDKKYPESVIAEIEGQYFKLPLFATKNRDLSPLEGSLSKAAEELEKAQYCLFGCIPRDREETNGRAIQKEEWNRIKETYAIAKCSEPFLVRMDSMYGKEYERLIQCIQTNVSEGEAELLNRLQEMGVETRRIKEGCINIRVE